MKPTLRRRWPTVISLLIVLSFLAIAALTACGASSPSRESSSDAPKNTSTSTSYGATGVTAPAAAPVVAPGSADAGVAAGATSGGSGAGTSSSNAQSSGTAAPTVPDPSKKIIKNGTLSLIVKDVDSAVTQVRGIALKYGGDVTQYSNSKTGNTRLADVILQVNGDQFEDAMRDLRGFDGVIDRRVDKADSKDVTEQYTDIDAQLKNLQVTVDQLRALQAKATRVDDVLAIQREITNTQGQIDRLKAQILAIDRRSEKSTITMHLETESAPIAPKAGWRFSEVVSDAWSASLRALQGFATVAISIVVFFWWLFPIIALVVLLVRYLRRRRAARPAPPTPPAAPATPATGN